MRNFILTVLFAVLCTAGLMAFAQDVPAQLGAAADQVKTAAAEAVKAVEAAMPAKLSELVARGAVRDNELSDTDECFDWYKDSDGAMYLVYVWGSDDAKEKGHAIVYSVCVAMGFAAAENIMYIFSFGIGVAPIRAITSIPMRSTTRSSMPSARWRRA